MAALRLIQPIAILAIVAVVFGRAASPSVAGLVVGMSDFVDRIELAGAAVTQVFGILAAVTSMGLVFAASRSKLPAHLKTGAVVLGGFIVLVGLSAAVARVPATSSWLVGISVVLLSTAAAVDAFRVPFVRMPAAALGLTGIASLLRLVCVAVAHRAHDAGSASLFRVARGVATVGFVFEALAMFCALAWLSLRGRKAVSPWTVIAFGVAFICARQALGGAAEDAGVVSVLLRRIAERLLPLPEPLLPMPVQVFVVYLAPIVAVFALAARSLVPSISAALALVLLGRGAPEAPLGALSILIGTLGIALGARDERGIWASIQKGAAAPRRGKESEPGKASASADLRHVDSGQDVH